MLNEGQERALKAVKEGQSCFISGPGGTGKSYLISHIVKEVKKSLKKVEVTALTGCAALLLGNRAKTIHSWAGIGLGRDTAHVLAMGMKKYNNRAFRRWLLTDTLIIDEISMMDPILLDKLDEIGRIIRRSEKPFGGIQMVFVGDFFQLPPVRSGKITPENSEKFRGLELIETRIRIRIKRLETNKSNCDSSNRNRASIGPSLPESSE